MNFNPVVFLAGVIVALNLGGIGILLLGLPGLFLYDWVQSLLSLRDLKELPETSPPGATYGTVGILLSVLCPIGIPVTYALAFLLPLPHSKWVGSLRVSLMVIGLCLWVIGWIISLNQWGWRNVRGS